MRPILFPATIDFETLPGVSLWGEFDGSSAGYSVDFLTNTNSANPILVTGARDMSTFNGINSGATYYLPYTPTLPATVSLGAVTNYNGTRVLGPTAYNLFGHVTSSLGSLHAVSGWGNMGQVNFADLNQQPLPNTVSDYTSLTGGSGLGQGLAVGNLLTSGRSAGVGAPQDSSGFGAAYLIDDPWLLPRNSLLPLSNFSLITSLVGDSLTSQLGFYMQMSPWLNATGLWGINSYGPTNFQQRIHFMYGGLGSYPNLINVTNLTAPWGHTWTGDSPGFASNFNFAFLRNFFGPGNFIAIPEPYIDTVVADGGRVSVYQIAANGTFSTSPVFTLNGNLAGMQLGRRVSPVRLLSTPGRDCDDLLVTTNPTQRKGYVVRCDASLPSTLTTDDIDGMRMSAITWSGGSTTADISATSARLTSGSQALAIGDKDAKSSTAVMTGRVRVGHIPPPISAQPTTLTLNEDSAEVTLTPASFNGDRPCNILLSNLNNVEIKYLGTVLSPSNGLITLTSTALNNGQYTIRWLNPSSGQPSFSYQAVDPNGIAAYASDSFPVVGNRKPTISVSPNQGAITTDPTSSEMVSVITMDPEGSAVTINSQSSSTRLNITVLDQKGNTTRYQINHHADNSSWPGVGDNQTGTESITFNGVDNHNLSSNAGEFKLSIVYPPRNYAMHPLSPFLLDPGQAQQTIDLSPALVAPQTPSGDLQNIIALFQLLLATGGIQLAQNMSWPAIQQQGVPLLMDPATLEQAGVHAFNITMTICDTAFNSIGETLSACGPQVLQQFNINYVPTTPIEALQDKLWFRTLIGILSTFFTIGLGLCAYRYKKKNLQTTMEKITQNMVEMSRPSSPRLDEEEKSFSISTSDRDKPLKKAVYGVLISVIDPSSWLQMKSNKKFADTLPGIVRDIVTALKTQHRAAIGDAEGSATIVDQFNDETMDETAQQTFLTALKQAIVESAKSQDAAERKTTASSSVIGKVSQSLWPAAPPRIFSADSLTKHVSLHTPQIVHAALVKANLIADEAVTRMEVRMTTNPLHGVDELDPAGGKDSKISEGEVSHSQLGEPGEAEGSDGVTGEMSPLPSPTTASPPNLSSAASLTAVGEGGLNPQHLFGTNAATSTSTSTSTNNNGAVLPAPPTSDGQFTLN